MRSRTGLQRSAGGDRSRRRLDRCASRANVHLHVHVKVVSPVGLGRCDRGLVQHADDLPGPLLPGGAQAEDACGVADQVCCALLGPGELGVSVTLVLGGR